MKKMRKYGWGMVCLLYTSTLVRGSLDVSSVTGRVPHTVTLKPCEQVVLDRNRDVMEKKVVETAPDVAWTCVGQRDEGISCLLYTSRCV